MQVVYYKWILLVASVFFFFVSHKIYSVVTGITEDNMLEVFQLMDSPSNNGKLDKKEQGFLKFCSKNG